MDLENPFFDRINQIESLRNFYEQIHIDNISDLFALSGNIIKLVEEPFLEDLISFELSKLLKNPLYTPLGSTYNKFNIFESRFFSLSLLSIFADEKKKDYGYISPSPNDQIILSLNEEEIPYKLYEQKNPYPVDTLDLLKNVDIQNSCIYLKKNQIIKLRKQKDIISFNENQSMLLLIFSSKSADPYYWEYNRETLKPSRIISSDQQSSRLEYVCGMLGELGNKSSVKTLKNLLTHCEHNVRWEAVRSLMSIDFDEGFKALNILKKDSHRDVRKGALEALKQLNTIY